RDAAADDFWTNRVERVAEAGGHAEVAAAAAQRPEQIGVFAFARAQQPPLGRHDIDPLHVVARPAEASRHIAEAAAERQPGDPRRRDETENRGETMELRLAVDVAEEAAGLGVRGEGRRIDPDAA